MYISGYKDSDFLNAPNIFKDHAWVCDAYVKRVLENNRNGRRSGGGRGTRASSDNTVYVYYLHFNWGGTDLIMDGLLMAT